MLELKKITFSADEKTILHDVDLIVPDGELLAITGPNGGGKSTLARIIAGIEKPDSGQILWNGQDITQLSITDRARLGLGYAFQQPVRFKGISVFELLKLAAGDFGPLPRLALFEPGGAVRAELWITWHKAYPAGNQQ
ncbi:MAG: ATP-binding cassette domain-containing protein [Peptococcaceae bacterium]